MFDITIVQICDFIGTIAFAISGIRLASAKRFDLFGAYVVGLTTAIGGGTLRDLMLSRTPFWMESYSYLICSAIALVWVILFRKLLVRQNNTWFLFDTIGLALFTVTGIQKTLQAGFPIWTAIVLGTITGAGGGVFRDVFINEEPLIFSERSLCYGLHRRRHYLLVGHIHGPFRRNLLPIMWRYSSVDSCTIYSFTSTPSYFKRRRSSISPIMLDLLFSFLKTNDRRT